MSDLVFMEPWLEYKRQRPHSPSSSSPPQLEDLTEEEYLALCLVMLAKDQRSQTRFQQSQPQTPHRESKKLSYKCRVCRKKFQSYQALCGHKASHGFKQPTGIATAPTVSAVAGEKHPISASGMIHECSICHKVFQTGQALGGHKSTHRNKPPTKVAKADDSSTALTVSAVAGEEYPISASDKTHECSICRKVFTTGQALGGHKRCHR